MLNIALHHKVSTESMKTQFFFSYLVPFFCPRENEHLHIESNRGKTWTVCIDSIFYGS